MAILFAFKVFARNLLRGVWRFLTWGLSDGLTCNQPTHYLLDYDDFFSTKIVSPYICAIICIVICNYSNEYRYIDQLFVPFEYCQGHKNKYILPFKYIRDLDQRNTNCHENTSQIC